MIKTTTVIFSSDSTSICSHCECHGIVGYGKGQYWAGKHIASDLANAALYYRLYTFVEDKNYMIVLCPDHSQSPVFDTLHCAKMEREGMRAFITYSDIET